MTAALEKRNAALAAVDMVEADMLVGLGTGSTAEIAIDLLAERARLGLSIVCVPTSSASARRARKGGLVVLDEPPGEREIDLTIDGADEVETGTLNLIKGLGGALLWEKIVAASSRRLVIIADTSKRVKRLGRRRKVPIPVEVVPFGWESTARRITALGATVERRLDRAGNVLRTDSEHFILDCHFPPEASPDDLERHLAGIPGVVESGLFIGMATAAVIGLPDGVDILHPGTPAAV